MAPRSDFVSLKDRAVDAARQGELFEQLSSLVAKPMAFYTSRNL